MKVTVPTSQTDLESIMETAQSGYIGEIGFKKGKDFRVKITNKSDSATVYVDFYRNVTTQDRGLEIGPDEDEVFEIPSLQGAKVIATANNEDVFVAVTASE